MKTITVTIAEGKKSFSRLIREAAERQGDIVVTKRGKPTAVIVAYGEYLHSKKADAYKKVLEARGVFAKAGVSAAKVYKEGKEALENRPWKK